MSEASMHSYNGDTDRCRCGGVVVYFDERPGDGFEPRGVGDGCELFGRPFKPVWVSGTEVITERGPGLVLGSYLAEGSRDEEDRWYFVGLPDGEELELRWDEVGR